MKRAALALGVLLVVPLAMSALGVSAPTMSAFGQERGDVPWYAARRDSTGMAPDPATTREAVLQIYGARTVGWRGIFGVHTWISVKPTGADKYTRYEVIGWGVQRGIPAIRVDRMGPDNYWFGARPDIYVDRRGPEVDALIDKVKAAVETYPWPNEYRPWPGPNSNTFIAWIAREVPELRLDLPPTAIGKDYLNGTPIATAPSGTGVQVSLFGLLGAMVALEEGVELNILGLTLGVDVKTPGVKLPGIGRVGFPQE
jgi:hypothetical protein